MRIPWVPITSRIYMGKRYQEQIHYQKRTLRTRCLKVCKSVWVRVSAFATTGIKLTRVPRRFMTSMSRGFNLRSRSGREMHPRRLRNVRMPSWPNEVQASMDTKVALISTHRLLLLPHVDFVLVVNEIDNWHP